MLSKIPPHSLDAERGVLGSILIDKDAISQVSGFLTAEDFYVPANAMVYKAMLDLFVKNRPIDLLTVREILDDRKELEGIGGNMTLIGFTADVFTSANVFQYAQIIKNKAILRRLIKAGNDIIALGFNEAEETGKLLEKAEQALFGVTQTFIQNRLVHIKEILGIRHDEILKLSENPELLAKSTVSSKFAGLDKMIGGFKRGDMIILAARPSMGKTALALNFAQNVAESGKNVAIFSLEMSKEQLADRFISSTMGLDSWKIQKGLLDDDEFSEMGDAIARLAQANIYIDDSPIGNLLEMKSKARRLRMEKGLDLIVIDYLQLMSGGNPMNRVQEISDISRGIKGLARELDVPVIALSQLSRAVESRQTKEPYLSDLRESGSIEQDADIVLMLFREDYYPSAGGGMPPDQFDAKKGVTTVFIRKNRNGPVGQVDLKFEKKFLKFYDIENHREGGGDMMDVFM